MKMFKKSICVLMSIIMVLSCFTAVAAAADETRMFDYTLKSETQRSNAFNADLILDEVDKALAQAHQDALKTQGVNEKVLTFQIRQEGMKIYIESLLTKKVVDLTSVNGICKTIDEFEGLVNFASNLLGDLKDLNLKTWKNKMQRSASNDELIVKEAIELIAANTEIIRKFCEGDLDLGKLVSKFINVNDLLGPDGVSGLVKKTLIDLVYDGADVDANYNKYKDDIDSFIYGDLLGKFADDFLPGFTMNSSTKVKDLICVVAGLVIENYMIPALKGFNVDLESSESADLKALAPYINLKGAEYDFSAVAVKNNGDFLSQANDIAGAVIKQMVPGYTWIEGDWTKTNDNLLGAFRYLGTKSGLIPKANEMNLEQIVIQVITIIARNFDLGAYGEGLDKCNSLEEAVARVLMNTAKQQKLNVTYKGNENWLVVLGDLLAAFMYDKFNITDENGKAYREGGSKDAFEVANYCLNYFLFDKKLASVLGLSTSKTEGFFTKMDKLIDYFGANKAVNFSLEKFLMGNSTQKGLLSAFMELDFEAIISMTAYEAMKDVGNVSAEEFVYKTVQYALNNWAGKVILPAYQSKAFKNALSKDHIGTLVENLILTISERRESVVPALFFTFAVLMNVRDTAEAITAASIADFKATNKKATPSATIKVGSKTLTQGVDFDLFTENSQPGAATAIIKGIGLYEGEFSLDYKIVLDSVKNLAVSSVTTSSAKLSWSAVPCADKYNVYIVKDGKNVLNQTVSETTATISSLSSGAAHTFVVEAVDTPTAIKSAQAKVTTTTKPGAVDAKKIKSSSTASSVTLTWTAASGAKGYVVEQYISKKWQKVADVTKATATINNLKGYTSYSFRVVSYTKDTAGKNLYGAASSSVSATTAFASTSLKAATASASSIKLTWSKSNNAKGYQIQQYVSGAWKTIKTTTELSYTVSSLKANTLNKFRVRPYSGSVYGPFSSAEAYTNPAKTSSLKVSKTTATSATLSWSKVSGATGYTVYQYADGKYTKILDTTKTSATISSLKSASTYTYYVKAYVKSGSTYRYSDYSSKAVVNTLPAQVKNLKATQTSSSIKLTWSKVTGANGYKVEQYSGKKWKTIKTTTATSLTVKGLKANTQYKFRVSAYKKLSSGNIYGAAASLSPYTALKKTSSFKVSDITASSAVISWSKVSGADGYVVYQYSKGKYVKKAEGNKTKLTLKKLSSGTEYTYYVRAYKKYGSTVVYGDYSSASTFKTIPGTVSKLKASSRKKDSIKLTWNSCKGATGYEIYRLSGKKWVKVGSTTKTTYTVKKLKKNTTFKFKVRAVQKISKKTTRYGAYSSTLSVKTRAF